MRCRRGTLALTGLLCALAMSPVAGQEPDSAVALDPILVRVLGSTVERGLPYSLSVTAGPELTRASAGAFLADAVRAVPGLQIHNRYNLAQGERLSIRGSGPRAQFGVRGIRILVDGIPATLPDGQSTMDHVDLAGLGRVEILRGPAAALYGNAAGGVLHLQTADPTLGPSSATARVVGGSHGLLSTQASVSGQAGSAGYRIGFNRLSYDGFRRDPVLDDGSTYGGGTRSVLNGFLGFPLAGGTLKVVAHGVDLDADNAGSLSESLLELGDRQAYRFNVISRTGKEAQQGQVGVAWSGPLGEWTGDFSGWGIRRNLDNRIPGTVIDLQRNAGGGRGLVSRRTDFEEGSLSWGAGFEGELQRDIRFNYENDGGARGPLTRYQIERVRSGGLFVQARVDLSAGVSFLGGMRYDRVRFEADDRFVNADDPDDSGARVMDALSPSLGFVIDAGRDFEVFGSVARSFETPTTTELANQVTGGGGFNPALDPQKGLTVEGGVRGRVSDAATVEVVLFRTKLDDELVPFEVPSDPGRTYFQNAGQTLSRGWEVAADARLSDEVSLRVAYTRVRARFEEFRTDDDDFSGNLVPGLAPHRVDAVLDAGLGPAFLELRGLYQAAVPVDNAGAFESDAYFIADLRMGLDDFRAGDVMLSPFATVSNIFDREYNSSVIVNAFGSRFYEPGPGRTFSLGAGITFAR